MEFYRSQMTEPKEKHPTTPAPMVVSDEMKDVLDMSSEELKARIAELETECKRICDVLDTRGQFVASAQMHDGWSGLHKTLSCWNDAIWWPTPQNDGLTTK